jgi:hypothetical protein
MAKMSNSRLATKVDCEGGVLRAITYGMRSEQIADPEIAALWSQAEKAYAGLEPVIREIERRLRATGHFDLVNPR